MKQNGPPADALSIFAQLQEAVSAQGTADARAKALLAAHVTSNLLLAERIEDLNKMLGTLVEEFQQQRTRSNGSRASSSPSPQARTTTGTPRDR